jgi:hypothetical protein
MSWLRQTLLDVSGRLHRWYVPTTLSGAKGGEPSPAVQDTALEREALG